MENEFNWKSFIYNIQSKAIVPVIGNDLSYILISKDSFSKSANFELITAAAAAEGNLLRINLYKYLAFKLWDIFVDKPITVPAVLNRVTLHLLDNQIPENDISNVISREINSLTDDQILLEPYLQLIRISGFEFIGAHVVGRRVDEVAGEGHALRDAGEFVAIDTF